MPGSLHAQPEWGSFDQAGAVSREPHYPAHHQRHQCDPTPTPGREPIAVVAQRARCRRPRPHHTATATSPMTPVGTGAENTKATHAAGQPTASTATSHRLTAHSGASGRGSLLITIHVLFSLQHLCSVNPAHHLNRIRKETMGFRVPTSVNCSVQATARHTTDLISEGAVFVFCPSAGALLTNNMTCSS